MTKRRKTGYVIADKISFTLACICAVLLLALAVNIVFGFTRAMANKRNETITVYVSPGDTLWDIAAENTPHDMDIRNVVDDIMRLSALDSAVINPGELLTVPLY